MKLAKISAAMLTITFLAPGTTNSAFANPTPKNTQQQTKNSGKKPDSMPTLSPKYSQQEIEIATDQFMETFSNQKLYATIFKYNPNVKPEVRKEARNIISTSPNAETAFYRGQALGATLTKFYLHKAIIKTPNSKLYEYIEYDTELLASLKSNAQLCVNYSLGRALSLNDFTKIDTDKITELKANIIESSYTHPTEFSPINKEEIIKILKNEFIKNKFDDKNIDKFKDISKLSPEETCEILYEFEYSIKTLGEDKGATLYKSMLYPQVQN